MTDLSIIFCIHIHGFILLNVYDKKNGFIT